MKHLLLFSFCWFGAVFSIAQANTDCATALEICNKSKLTFESQSGRGVSEDLGITCLSTTGLPNTLEVNSTWLRWKIQEAGTLTFTIQPNDPLDDFDFIVFKVANNGDCMNRTPVRCMATGAFQEDVLAALQCLGTTGLLETERDTAEFPGCNTGNNNYVAALQTQIAEEYILFINNFSGSGKGFSIAFCGTAMLPCDTMACSKIQTSVTTLLETSFKVYPNPLVGNELMLETPDFSATLQKVEIYEVTGRLLLQQPLQEQLMQRIAIPETTRGVLLVKIVTDNGIVFKKIIRQ